MNFSLPSQPNLAQLRKQAKSILKLHGQGDPRCCFVLKRLRQFADMPEQKVLDADLALSDVQFALALYYGYESWAALKRHTEMQRPGVVPRLHRTSTGAARSSNARNPS
jgi:hypothetical protein